MNSKRRKQLHELREESESLLFELEQDLQVTSNAMERGKLQRNIQQTEVQLARLKAEIAGRFPVIPPGFRPYKGLSTFRQTDAAYFFGRDKWVDEQLMEAIRREPLTAVIGSSGSGKSSVVFAGLLPRLEGEGQWKVASFRSSDRPPGDHPFLALADALVPLYETEKDQTALFEISARLAKGLQEKTYGLIDVVSRIWKTHPEHNLLLVADQFEEIYTLCTNLEERNCFLEVLLEVIKIAGQIKQDQQFKLVLTLRADFFNYVVINRNFADVLQNRQLNLGPMNREELQEVIEEPAYRLGIEIEDGLTERILDAVSQEPGDLPLLEFALDQLWLKCVLKDGTEADSQEPVILTHAAYNEIGGVREALARYATEQYLRLSPDEQRKAKQIFIQLVQPGAGMQDTRRVAVRSEIGEENWALVTELANTRLVVSGFDRKRRQETVEVVHEALIDGWSQFREWMEQNRAFRSWQEQLRTDLYQWEKSKRDEGALLSGLSLAVAEEWLQKREGDLSEVEQKYIKASVALRDREYAKQLRLRRRVIYGLAAAVIITLSLAIAAIFFALQVENQRKISQIAAQAFYQQDKEFSLALLLAREASLRDNNEQTRVSLANAVDYKPALITFLHGHTNSVDTVTFSPNGKYLASGSGDGTIRLWDVGTKKQIGQPLNGHMGESVRSLTFSSDSQTLASGGNDKTVELWDVTNPAEPKMTMKFKDPTDLVQSVVFSPNGKYLASGSNDGIIRLWDVATGQLLKLFSTPDGIITVAFSPDGKYLASGGYGSAVQLWNVDTGEKIGTPLKEDDNGLVYSLAFSPNGNILAAATYDSKIRLWDVTNIETKSPKLLFTLTGHTGPVYSLALSSNFQTTLLASGSSDGTVRLWNYTNGQFQEEIRSGFGFSIETVAFHPDGKTLAVGSEDGTIQLYNTDWRLPVLKGHTDQVLQVLFSSDSKGLISASGDQTVRIWNIDTFNQTVKIPLNTSDNVKSAAFAPNGRVLALGSNNGTIRIYDINSQQLKWEISENGNPVSILTFNSDGTILASIDTYNTIKLWDVVTGRFKRQIKVPIDQTKWISSLAFSPDNTILASGEAYGIVRLWNVEDGKLKIEPLIGHTNVVYTLVFSPDGKTLASAGEDTTIRLWDVATGKQKGIPLVGHLERIFSLAFNPEGTILASAGEDKTVRLWDVATGQSRGQPLTGHQDRISSLAFSPDGTILASGSRDKTIRLWKISSFEEQKIQACKMANRNFTEQEWNYFIGGSYDPSYKTCPDNP